MGYINSHDVNSTYNVSITTNRPDDDYAMKTIGQLKKDVDDAQQRLDAALEKAVKADRPFADLAMVLGQTEAAIRLKAGRKGWYKPGTRRSPSLLSRDKNSRD